MTDKFCAQGFASGRVQGVWFRAFTRECALRRDVTGWARNLPDGSVEFLLCGTRAAVLEVISDLRQGPPQARVDSIDWEERPWSPLEDFSIR